MASKLLLSQTGVAGTTGTYQNFPGNDTVRVIQFTPAQGAGFTGTVIVESSISTNPSNSEFTQLATVTFTAHTTNLTLEMASNAPSIRVRIPSGITTTGNITVYGDSATRAIQGSQGTTPYTAYVESSTKVAGTGTGFKINSPVVASITSDDVVYATDFTKTVTSVLDGLQTTANATTATPTDINLLAGLSSYGLTAADMKRVADTNATTTEVNYLSGVTSSIQTQLNTLSSSIPASLAGTTVTSSVINSFFDTTPTVNITALNNLNGLTAASADLNLMAGTSAYGLVNADLKKLADVNATAAEINKISGFTGTSTDLNKIVGLTSAVADLNAISGLSTKGVTATQLAFLNGLTTNVQAAINTIPSLSGLTASANDLNLLAGASAGSGSYSGKTLSATELGYLDGVTSAIQAQLDAKRNTATAIGISEISGASISITELNYLQGLTGNIQSQFTGLSSTYMPLAGGTLTGALVTAAGSATAPAIGVGGTANGLYKLGTGVGVTVGGQVISIDATGTTFGNGTAKSAYIKHAAGTTANPTYAFVGDLTSGLNSSGAGIVDVVANGKVMASFNGTTGAVNIGGVATDNTPVTFTGVLAGEKMLGKTTTAIDLKAGTTGTAIPLYTVPTARNAVVTKIVAEVVTATGVTGAARLNIGTTGTATQIVDNTTNTTVFSALNGAKKVVVLTDFQNIGSAFTSLAAATVINAKIATLDAAATALTVNLYVFGFEY